MDLVELNIPAYDEYENLVFLLPEILKVSKDIREFEFRIKVVVKNQESIETIEMLRGFGVEAIFREPDDTFGSAIFSGINTLSAKAKYIIFMDADGSHQPSNIPLLLDTARDTDSDIVVASRYVQGGKTDNSLPLIIMSRVLNIVFQFTLGIKCKDVSTNYKLYKAENIRGLVLTSKNYDVVEELLLKAKIKAGKDFKLTEIPDHFQQRKFGKSKRKLTVFILSYLVTILKLRIVSYRENSNSRR